jgi:hypothetical protein
MLDVVEIVRDSRSGPGGYHNVSHTAKHAGARFYRRLRQGFARLRVAYVERAPYAGHHAFERDRVGLGHLSRNALVIHNDTRRVAASGSEQHIGETEALRLGYAPGRHVLTAHLVVVDRLPLEDEHVQTCAAEHGCERGTADARADDDDVVLLRHGAPPCRKSRSNPFNRSAASTGTQWLAPSMRS